MVSRNEVGGEKKNQQFMCKCNASERRLSYGIFYLILQLQNQLPFDIPNMRVRWSQRFYYDCLCELPVLVK